MRIIITVMKARKQDASAKPVNDVIVIAASVGGIKALSRLLSQLPADLPVPVAIVQHRTPTRTSLLAPILARVTPLRVKDVVEGEPMQPGTVYIAPPERHLKINQNHTLALLNGRCIRHVLSSANPLFTSAAQAFKEGVIAVVLTGGDADATDGVQSVKAAGGIVIAQDQESSQSFSMPKSAIDTGCVDYILPLDMIGPALLRLVRSRHSNQNDYLRSQHVS